MTIPGNLIEPNARRDWATEQLEIAPDATPQTARVAFLQRLENTEFCPPDVWFQALKTIDQSVVLSGKMLSAIDAEVERDQYEKLAAEVEGFTQQFWKLPVTERQLRWRGLCERAKPHPKIAAWLGLLESGIALDPSPETYIGQPNFDGKDRVILENLIDWFPLPPPDRARLRREWLASIIERRKWQVAIKERRKWQAAAKAVAAQKPSVSALDPDMVKFLTSLSSLDEHAERGAKGARRSLPSYDAKNTQSSYSSYPAIFCYMILISVVFNVFKSRDDRSVRSIQDSSPTTVFKREKIPGPETDNRPKPKLRFEFHSIAPELFMEDDRPRILPRLPFNLQRPNEELWRAKGGKYLDEVSKDGPAPKIKTPEARP